MGIYSSRKSAWQRRVEGLPQDHAGPSVIGEVVGDDKIVKKPLANEEVEEVEDQVEDKDEAPKSSPKKTGKKSSDKD